MDRNLEMIGSVGAIRAEVLREPPLSFDFFGRQLVSDGVLAVALGGIRAILVPRENGAGPPRWRSCAPKLPPRLHPDFTQEVAPNESQRGPKPLTREALIYDALFVGRWLWCQIGKGS